MNTQHIPALIIIEGPDLAGKSTFVDKFDDSKYIKHHFGAGEVITNAEDYFTVMLRELWRLWYNAKDAKKDIIIDRSWISDAAYEHVRKDGGRVTSAHNMSYNGLCLGLFRKVVTVFLVPQWDIIEKRFYDRGDAYVSLDQLKIAYNYYSNLKNDITGRMYDCLKYGIPTNNSATSVLFYDNLHNDNVDINGVIKSIEFLCKYSTLELD